MKFNFLMKTAALTACLAPIGVANAATINPIYDAKLEYQKYWTPIFKQQVNAMCRLLGDHIANPVKIDITITIGTNDTMKTPSTDASGKIVKDASGNIVYSYAAGTGSPQTAATGSTPTKYIASTGTFTINSSDFDDAKSQWKSNNCSLILHELIHCLGFSKGIPAFDANIVGNQFSGTYTKLANNQKAFPLNGAGDLSHFQSGVTDRWGVYPRMMASGGNLLSEIDLAALVDIGYDIPKIKTKTAWLDDKLIQLESVRGKNPVDFVLNGILYGVYKPGFSQYGANIVVSGGGKEDVMTNQFSPNKQRIILQGNSGSDVFYVEDQTETVLTGDDPSEVEKGNDNPDTYFIDNLRSTVIIVGYGSKDTIYLPYGPGIGTRDLSRTVTVESLPQTTPEEKLIASTLPIYLFGTKEKPVGYFPRKVTHILSKTVEKPIREFINGKFVEDIEYVTKEIGRFVFYCYALKTVTNEILKEKLLSSIDYVNNPDSPGNPATIIIKDRKNYYEINGG